MDYCNNSALLGLAVGAVGAYFLSRSSGSGSSAPTRPKKVTVGYWSIRGLGAPLRMMCMYSGVPTDVVLYDLKEEVKDGKSSWDASPWFGKKPELKEQNPLMNLPYVSVDGGRLIAQTNACFSYLGRALGLFGATPEEAVDCEQLLCEAMDLRNKMVGWCYGRDSSDAAGLIKSVEGICDKLELWLTRNSSDTFFVGNSATAPDFHIWELLDQYELVSKVRNAPSLIASRPALAGFHKKFAALSANQRYVTSKLHTGLPCNNKMAQFGSALEGAAWTTGMEYNFDFGGTY